jgi:hypothetical protein
MPEARELQGTPRTAPRVQDEHQRKLVQKVSGHREILWYQDAVGCTKIVEISTAHTCTRHS